MGAVEAVVDWVLVKGFKEKAGYSSRASPGSEMRGSQRGGAGLLRGILGAGRVSGTTEHWTHTCGTITTHRTRGEGVCDPVDKAAALSINRRATVSV